MPAIDEDWQCGCWRWNEWQSDRRHNDGWHWGSWGEWQHTSQWSDARNSGYWRRNDWQYDWQYSEVNWEGEKEVRRNNKEGVSFIHVQEQAVGPRCRLCGRMNKEVYILDGFPLALCTLGDYSCLFYQVQKHRRSAGVIIQKALACVFANGLMNTVNRPPFMMIVVQFLFGTEKDLFGITDIPTVMQSFFREKWLRSMHPLCNSYDARLLRLCVASLPIPALQKVIQTVNAFRSEYSIRAGRQCISKMAMRRILSETFAKLAPQDIDIHTMKRLWEF